VDGAMADKKSDPENGLSDDGTILVQQYRGVMAMIQQNYLRRTATNRFYFLPKIATQAISSRCS
jgi:hypothetical protein